MAENENETDKKKGKFEAITVRFPPDMAESLREIAKENNCSLAKLVRDSFELQFAKYLRSVRFLDYDQGDMVRGEILHLIRCLGRIEYELSRISVNVNAIAQKANENSDIDTDALDSLLQQQKMLMDQYESATKDVGEELCRILE